MGQLISSNRNQFVDFLKGLCIISVILTHCFPYHFKQVIGFALWGGMAVPLFLTLQSYHFFRKYKKDNTKTYSLRKIVSRILIPFILTNAIILCFFIADGKDFWEIIKNAVICGGLGPGSYYIWIYLQFVCLLPLWLKFIKLLGGVKTIILAIVLSQLIEFMCIFINPQEYLYRLCFFRYFLLLNIGLIWSENNICSSISKKWTAISILSLIVLIALEYFEFNTFPILFESDWRVYHWPIYFYSGFLLPRIIWKLFTHCSTIFKIKISRIGMYSFEIFLTQMIVFAILPKESFESIFDSQNINSIVYVLITFTCSVLPVVLLKKYKETVLLRNVFDKIYSKYFKKS